MLRLMLFISLFSVQVIALSQPRTIKAVKISQAPRIDGNLDDVAWQQAPEATDFVENFPTFGLTPSVRSVVKIVYDNSAIYVGAYLYDNPSLIRKQITARDEEQRQDADYFSVFLDTYNDQQNGFQFLVTAANVQTDARMGGNIDAGFGEFGDRSWDAVWQSEVKIKNDGWVVEMKIPYISLRFSKKEVQTWGLQFLRFVRRNNENDFWNPVNPVVSGFANQFGKYQDLKDIDPPLRLSFSPYLSGGVRFNPEGNREGTQWLRNGGMDVKYGINESFTLDATLIPDFGQVVSDDIVNNLTPFEVRFKENRPFFTEGTELFNKSGLFYSRRVGAIPPGYYGIEDTVTTDPNLKIIKNPSVTQLYNAIKFSGRTKHKLGIGIFNALAAPMYATVQDNTTHATTNIQTAPLTNYNLIVLDQALKGRSYITLTNASTIRNGTGRDANVSALDFSLFDRTNTYNIRGTGRYSKIFSTSPYDGYNTTWRAGKVSGSVQYFAQADIYSTNYDPRDLGYLETSNLANYTAGISYNQFSPTKNFVTYAYSLSLTHQRIFRPNEFSFARVVGRGFWVFKNFWDVTLSAGWLPDQHDYFLLGKSTEGLFVRRPQYGFAEVSGSTDSRKKLFFSYDLLESSFFHANPEKHYHIVDLGLRYRFSNKLSVDLEHRNEGESNYIVNSGKTEANGDPIIGFVDFKDISTTLSGNYNFTPSLNLLFRVRHYWSRVPYNNFANVDAEGYPVARPFIAGQDENVNYFNVDAFLNWNFKLGSFVTLGYKNWLGDNNAISGVNFPHYFNNLGQSFTTSHGNEISLKVIYFLDYNQLKKKNH
ncbi:MAG: DUF5916 domain-containing protein [Flavisolibacter sp.]